jgi:NADH:ubiquinone oxidoreductase subunit 6 (subunit J)
MKSSVVILSLFLLASFSIIVVSRVNKLQKKGKQARFENRINRTIPATTVEWTDTVQNLGKVLYKDYLLPFELASVLFLAAMVGAVYLSKKETSKS